VPAPLCSPVDAPEKSPALEHPWNTAWGLIALRVIPDGLRTAPNGQQYHPNFSFDVNLNCWLWRSQGLYVFGDTRFWGEKPEFGVTNSRDGFMGTSKREFDLWGGAAWNYAGPWELRFFGYSLSNLNRGVGPVRPSGYNDGSGVENRYYLSQEYASLGQTGFDVTRATFLSVGYFFSKDLVGNDGKNFNPGLLLRGYLTYDLFNWPAYVFGDAEFISDDSLSARLLLFDLGVAVRPLPFARQWEFRLGTENTGDFQVGNVQSSVYVSFRFIF
jgi:hypothetical protein